VSSDVAVVGAGIGGAVLALALGNRGWTVTLLERDRVPHTVPRPEILWGATPDALDRFGIGDLIRQQASVRLGGINVRQGNRRLLTISRRVLDSAVRTPPIPP
jgi:2-polyprenyl-6-methoxyphenol hydroxylase-like FAD-dependent oxidoreductase